MFNEKLFTYKYSAMTENQYFNYGLPDHPRAPQYGLYFPVGDCFLFVLKDQRVAYTLSAILSSRYVTIVTLLNTADNYDPTTMMLDNNSCTNWTASNKNEFNTIMALYTNPLRYVKELVVASDLHNNIGINMQQEQQWAAFCCYWIERIYHQLYSSPNFIDIDYELNNFLQIDGLGYQARPSLKLDSIRQILKILYLEKDFKQAESQINAIGLCL